MLDQELRYLVFDGIVNVEVFLKSYMATELAKATGRSVTVSLLVYLDPAPKIIRVRLSPSQRIISNLRCTAQAFQEHLLRFSAAHMDAIGLAVLR